MTFLTVFAASALGQLAALWVVGWHASRQQMKQAMEIHKMLEEDVRSGKERMEKYIAMES